MGYGHNKNEHGGYYNSNYGDSDDMMFQYDNTYGKVSPRSTYHNAGPLSDDGGGM